MSDVSLVSGWLPTVLLVTGAAGLIGLLLARRFTAGWWVYIGVAAVVAGAVAVGLNYLVVNVLGLFPEPMPASVVGWLAVGAGAVVLLVGAMFRTNWRRKLLAVVCTGLVLTTVAAQVNLYFQEYQTVADLFAEEPGAFAGSGGGSQSESTPVVERWSGQPRTSQGQLATATIPGTLSGFVARDAYVYTPPAYSADNPPLLPVMVLVAGQPGTPGDWITGGTLPALLDTFAQAHNGLAPVAVVVDPNGSELGNTMCMDSNIAKADTYLSKDVPAWIAANLRIDTNPQHWTFAGWSFGGTCAVQMGTMHPDIWKSIVAFQAEREPALGPDRNQTIATAFGGDEAAFDAKTPLTLMSTKTYPDTWAYFASGSADPGFTAYLTELAAAATKSGMQVRTGITQGQGHSWGVPIDQMPKALAWLSPKLGFTRS
jgi:S-formylglutathione hydrolase FrmB